MFVREVGAINNAAYRDINRVETLVASGHLRRLRDLGLLNQKGQGRATYYVPSDHLLEAPPAEADALAGQPEAGSSEPGAMSSEPGAISSELDVGSSELDGLPSELMVEIRAIGARASDERLRELLLQVCALRPMRADELGQLFGRRPVYLRHRYLRPLIEEGRLAYLFPNEPTHSLQAYRTVPRSEAE